MKGFTALPWAPRVARVLPPRPKAGKRTVKTSHYCFTCKVAFTYTMLLWHLDNDHLMIPCKVCGGRVTAFLSNDPLDHDLAHFCSLDCKHEAVRRRLCPRCAKPSSAHPGAPDWCASCSRNWDYIEEQIRTVNEILQSMEVRRSC